MVIIIIVITLMFIAIMGGMGCTLAVEAKTDLSLDKKGQYFN